MIKKNLLNTKSRYKDYPHLNYGKIALWNIKYQAYI